MQVFMVGAPACAVYLMSQTYGFKTAQPSLFDPSYDAVVSVPLFELTDRFILCNCRDRGLILPDRLIGARDFDIGFPVLGHGDD